MEVKEYSPEEIGNVARDFVFLATAEKFLPYSRGRWCFDILLSEKGMINYLVSARRHDLDIVNHVFKERLFQTVEGSTMNLSADRVVTVDGRSYLNLYIPPTIQPAPGHFPRIEATLDWLTDGDAAGKAWLVNWIAAKVQRPLFLPRVAVVFSGSPGAGKGTLAAIIGQMLGRENCAAITNRNLANKFNSRWTNKLFVLADEVLTRENHESISETLKILIDSGRIELEKKGRDQVEAENRIAWVFASNDQIPIDVERGDRRYTVFANAKPVPPEHTAMLKSAFDGAGADSTQPTESFAAEIAGFMHHCLSMTVDFARARTVYENADRSALMSANRPSTEAFFEAIETHPGTMDRLLDWVADNDEFVRASDRTSWDFGDAIKTNVLYRCYRAFCSEAGFRVPLHDQKFGAAVKAQGYTVFNPAAPVGPKRQVRCYRGPWLRVESEPKAVVSNVVNMKGR